MGATLPARDPRTGRPTSSRESVSGDAPDSVNAASVFPDSDEWGKRNAAWSKSRPRERNEEFDDVLTCLASRFGYNRSRPTAGDLRRRGWGPWAAIRWAVDCFDERHARRRLADFGKRRWLVSWYRGVEGGWRARLSCPSLPYTIERAGKSRSEAIQRAEIVLCRILSFRREQTADSERASGVEWGDSSSSQTGPTRT
jgi:hypothetical protein